MREAIERMVTQFEIRRDEANAVAEVSKKLRQWHHGRANELGFAISMLKAVLAEHETGDTRNPPDHE